MSEWKECVDKSVRIGLTIHPDGRHVFDDTWVVEQMPGPRCIFDGTLLPNGHIVLTGGQKVHCDSQLCQTHCVKRRTQGGMLDPRCIFGTMLLPN